MKKEYILIINMIVFMIQMIIILLMMKAIAILLINMKAIKIEKTTIRKKIRIVVNFILKTIKIKRKEIYMIITKSKLIIITKKETKKINI